MATTKAVNAEPLVESGKKYLDKDGLAYFIEKNDQRYVKQEEGKGLSANDFTDEYKQKIDDLSYVKIAVNSMSATNSSNEIGSKVTDTTVTWSLNKEPKSQKIKFSSEAEETLGTNIRSKAYTGKSVTSNAVIKLTVTDERDAEVSKQVTIQFQPKVYYGVSEDPNALDSEAVNALTGVLASSKARTFSANAGAGEYIVYIIPSSFGTPTFNVGGFDGGFKKTKTMEHTNASGYKQNYDIWQSVQPALGQTSVTVK